MGEDMIPILTKAAKESKGETIDIVFEHELPGVTEEMYAWWGQNMSKFYKMWHPDHISFEIEETGNPENPTIAHPTEMIGKYGPSTMSFGSEPLSKYPRKPKYKNYRLGNHYAKDGTLLSLTCSEHEDGPNGLKVFSVHIWPAKTPQDLVDALRKHCTEEAENFPKFLPELYKRETGRT
jgi:hypothetical protein